MGGVTRYTYDKLGNVLTTTDARNNVTYIEYDIMNRVSRVTDALKNENTRIYYDKNGNPTEYYDAYGLIQKITYDGLNRPVAIEDALGNAVETQYDGIGNVTAEIDALNASTYYRYDKMGRLTELTDSQNGVIQYDYSELGQTKSLTDANGNHTTWVYDLVGNLTYEKNAAGNEKLYEYDKLNRLEFFVNGRGERLEYKYDNTDMLTYAAGTFYTHDQNGNVLTVANENGTTKREYDKNDRVTKFTDVNGNAIGYTYDEAGNLIKLTYPAGEVVSYTYDALNRLTAVTDYNGRITKYEYDKNSRLVKTTRPDGSIEEITYDRAGRMTAKIDKAASGELINQYEYTYNANGDIIEEKDLHGNRTTPIKAESTEMTYGAANRLESVNGQVVSYDADGNMIKGVLGGGAASFGYDKFNRLIRVSAEVTENVENTTVYKYDGEGNRISVNNSGEVTFFVTDPTGSLSNLLESRNHDGSKTIYVYGVGLISQEKITAGSTRKVNKAAPENTTEYRLFHYDYRGSTTALTNANGNVTDRVVYSPYGKIDERIGETKTSFLYVGQFGVQVDENGLHYMRARYYDPHTSRMLSEDIWAGNPIVPLSMNKYTYCYNNPVMYIDYSGNIPIPVIIVAVCVIAKVVDYGWTAWDVADSSKTLVDTNANDADRVLAAVNIGLAVSFEAIEPDDLLPVGLPLDDVARKTTMKAIREKWYSDGPVAVKNFLRRKLGSNADSAVKVINEIIESSVENTGKWSKGSYDSIKDSLIDHFFRHGNEVGATDVQSYLRKAEEFTRNLKNSRKYAVDGFTEGAIKYVKNGKYVIMLRDTILSFGKVIN
jgi:RHS repeat-associated protein